MMSFVNKSIVLLFSQVKNILLEGVVVKKRGIVKQRFEKLKNNAIDVSHMAILDMIAVSNNHVMLM